MMRRISPWLPGLAMIAALAATAYQLRIQGRLWMCSCAYLLLWSGDAWSSDTSQHLLDPYSFTHVLHGFVFYGLLALIVPRLPVIWRLCLAVSIEAVWEVVENSEFVIRRYREGTAPRSDTTGIRWLTRSPTSSCAVSGSRWPIV